MARKVVMCEWQRRGQPVTAGLSGSGLVATVAGTRPDRTGRPVPLAEAGEYQLGAIRDHELSPSSTNKLSWSFRASMCPQGG